MTNPNTFGLVGGEPVDLSGYVPYTGATGAVDLGAQNLTTTGTGTFKTLSIPYDLGSGTIGKLLFGENGDFSIRATADAQANLDFVREVGTGHFTFSGGKVGIGTVPAMTLHVVGNESGNGLVRLQNTANDGYTTFDLYNSAGNLAGYFGFGNPGAGVPGVVYFGSGGNFPVTIQTNNIERVRISNVDGGVHINSDSQKLYFGAADDWSFTFDGTNFQVTPEVGTGYLNLHKSTTATWTGLRVFNDNNSYDSQIIIGRGATTCLTLGASGGGGVGYIQGSPNYGIQFTPDPNKNKAWMRYTAPDTNTIRLAGGLNSDSGTGNNFIFQGGSTHDGYPGGDMTFKGGSATDGDSNPADNGYGGDIIFQGGGSENTARYGQILFQNPLGTVNYMVIDPAGEVIIPSDTTKLSIGIGSDLKLYHDGTNSYVYNDTGILKIQDAGSGINVGTATTELLGFYGVTPVDQPATVADADGTLADATTKINTIIDRLQELGLVA